MLDVGTTREFPPGTAKPVAIPTATVALFNLGGRMFALDDACVRCGSSLAAGSVIGGDVACAGCGWCYDIATGNVQGVPALCTDTFAATVDGSRILLATEPLARRE
jgi:nitrite reductase/ring-hydroxylating ferredoxin subunit